MKKISRLEIEELDRKVSWLFSIRWFASIIFFVFIFFARNILNLQIKIFPAVLIPVITFFYNFIFSFFIDNIRKSLLLKLLNFQLILDITSLIILNYFLGGVEINIAFLSIFYIIFSGILLPAQSCIFISIFTIFIYNIITFAYLYNIIPFYHIYPKISEENFLNKPYIIINSITFTSIVLICSIATISIMRRLRARESQIINLQALTEYQKKEIEKKAEKLKKLNILKSSFMMEIEHQLKSPIASALSIIEILSKNYENIKEEEKRSFILSISKKLKFMQEMIYDLLYVSQVTDPDYDFKIDEKNVDLNNLIEKIISELKEFAQKQNNRIIFKPDYSIKPIFINEKYLNLVFTNLIHNAIKYTNNGTVTITTENFEKNIEIKISDTGIGIKEEDIKNLFTEFYRSPDVKEKGIEGTGLGLYIVKKILERVNGSIKVESIYGKGTTFIISLPLKKI